jgi:phosphopantetheine adenylyltransferase / dephospho-CoA kinase
LGHQTYIKQSNAYNKIIEEFGSQILDSNENINRKALGSIVFADQLQLKKLTDIVWPEISNLVDQEVEKLFREGKSIIVVEAALLIDAKWHLKMNEIWLCYITEDESIRRTMERDKVSEQDARRRLNSQISNKERVNYANVVLATLWEPEYTQKQCEKAWNLLMKRTKDKI